MGYDMTIVQERDQAETDAIAAAHTHVKSLPSPYSMDEGEERDRAEKTWHEAWKAYDEADRSYFRLNVRGMSRCVDLMNALGMVSSEEAPRFPQLAEYSLDSYPERPEQYESEERAAVEAKLTDDGRRFLAAEQAVTDYEPQPIVGIPVGKFSTNDGWLVTPGQCKAALAAYEAAPEAKRAAISAGVEWWPGWIAYLTYAQDRGGFRVC